MATHSSILVWRIPWTEELGKATVERVTESDTTERLSLSDIARACVCVCMCVDTSIYIFIPLDHFALQLKLTEDGKSTLLEFKEK